MLNRFFDVVVDEVEGSGGLLNKFEGDAALCVFGAPVELDDPATRRCAPRGAIRDRVASMGEFEVGIGVAAGAVIAGQVGAHSRLEYTVIGDAVNEAARLTDLAKRAEGHILASQAVLTAAAADRAALLGAPGGCVLRGREVADPQLWTAGAALDASAPDNRGRQGRGRAPAAWPRSAGSETPTTLCGSPSTRSTNQPPSPSMVNAPATSVGSPVAQ